MMNSDYLKNNKINLNPGMVLDVGCDTCGFGHGNVEGDLFCTQGIRRGVLMQQGAVDQSPWHEQFTEILEKSIIQGKSIGEAYRDARNTEFYNSGGDGDGYYALIGDPTWRPKWW